jgi:predicted dehydrogenase
LRYTLFTQKLKKLIDEKLIGDLVNIQALEPVGYWHQAHSFVRGNWRNEKESSSMLLAKCCHDIDWINYIIPAPCSAIQSFGNLRHFRASEKPVGAADRCTDCSIESSCPYSALKIYFGVFDKGSTDWPLDVLTPNPTRKTILEALQTGPYGRCVYACDNDVVDHQTVNMEFEDGTTATLTMTAFTQAAARKIRLFGTKGELDCDGKTIRHFDFMTDQWNTIKIPSSDPSILGGHGGGDYGLMKAFITAISQNNSTPILSGPEATMLSHQMVFSAEESRHNQCVISLKNN